MEVQDCLFVQEQINKVEEIGSPHNDSIINFYIAQISKIKKYILTY